ncbi:hypothetical protein MKY25_13505 [Geobacillus sp. FSL W8-0032]|uniref:hypothetical protein n=1 Tax=Geobacillus TaxID=129337 RepID=UPI001F2923B0|nr:hypothetical protein [Geobacillus icigianus]
MMYRQVLYNYLVFLLNFFVLCPIPIKLRILVFVHRQKHGILSNEHSTFRKGFFHGKTNASMDSNHSPALFSQRNNPSRTENKIDPATAFVNGGSLSDSLCMGDGLLSKQVPKRLCAALTLWHGCSLSSEGLNQRFTDRAVAFLREVFFLLLLHQRPLLWSTIQAYHTSLVLKFFYR